MFMLLGTIYAIIQHKWHKFAMRLVDHALSPFPNKHLKSLVRKPKTHLKHSLNTGLAIDIDSFCQAIYIPTTS